jgi:hypothetical protein
VASTGKHYPRDRLESLPHGDRLESLPHDRLESLPHADILPAQRFQQVQCSACVHCQCQVSIHTRIGSTDGGQVKGDLRRRLSDSSLYCPGIA